MSGAGLDICDVGASPQLFGGAEGLIMPLFATLPSNGEQEWSNGVRACLYGKRYHVVANSGTLHHSPTPPGFGLFWAFIGVAIVADIFMVAIESITAVEKLVIVPQLPAILSSISNPIPVVMPVHTNPSLDGCQSKGQR